MPIYEYRCDNCHRKVSVYVRVSSETPKATCPKCGSASLTRLFSTFAIRKSESAVYEDILSDNNLVRGLESNDPRALAEWNRKMNTDSPSEVAPEYQEMVERMEAGEAPSEPGSSEKTEDAD